MVSVVHDLSLARAYGTRAILLDHGQVVADGPMDAVSPILSMMGMYGESFRLAFGMVCIYIAFGIIRMGNWTHNDTFRAAGDATYGTVLEIVFMWLLVLPCVCLSGLVFHWPTLVIFALCYVDEPIRYGLMQRHLYSGKWIRPVTLEGMEALKNFHPRVSAKEWCL